MQYQKIVLNDSCFDLAALQFVHFNSFVSKIIRYKLFKLKTKLIIVINIMSVFVISLFTGKKQTKNNTIKQTDVIFLSHCHYHYLLFSGSVS